MCRSSRISKIMVALTELFRFINCYSSKRPETPNPFVLQMNQSTGNEVAACGQLLQDVILLSSAVTTFVLETAFKAEKDFSKKFWVLWQTRNKNLKVCSIRKIALKIKTTIPGVKNNNKKNPKMLITLQKQLLISQ